MLSIVYGDCLMPTSGERGILSSNVTNLCKIWRLIWKFRRHLFLSYLQK